MKEAITEHPIAFFTGIALGAVMVGLLMGLVPLVAGAVTHQKRLGISGFFACLVSSLIAGALLAVPMALGFTVKIVLNWKKAKVDSQPSSTGTHGT